MQNTPSKIMVCPGKKKNIALNAQAWYVGKRNMDHMNCEWPRHPLEADLQLVKTCLSSKSRTWEVNHLAIWNINSNDINQIKSSSKLNSFRCLAQSSSPQVNSVRSCIKASRTSSEAERRTGASCNKKMVSPGEFRNWKRKKLPKQLSWFLNQKNIEKHRKTNEK